MTRPARLLLMSVCALAGLLGTTRWFHTTHVFAQQDTQTYDDGSVYIYAWVDVDSNYNLWAKSYTLWESDLYEDIDLVQDEIAVDEDQGVGYDNFAPVDVTKSDFGELEFNPVPPGHEYGVTSFGYVCIDDEAGGCTWQTFPYASTPHASVNVPSPPPQITSISPSSVTQGDQGTLTITGSNFIESSGDQLTINFSGPSNPFTLTSAPSVCTATCTASFSYDFTLYPAGTYTLSVTNNEGTSNGVTFMVLASPPPPPPPDPCAVTSNPRAGYSSIVSTGTAGGSGTLAVSFSGAVFAAISPSVTYGPYSTPSSIAANIAALITKNYFRYGLTAKAYGPNVVYSGTATLGTVRNVTTGPSFSTTTSTGAGTAVEVACHSAPIPPAPPSEVAIVGFIDKDAISLPSGESLLVDGAFPPFGVIGGSSPGNPLYDACFAETGLLGLGQLGVVSSAADKAYASAWLLKYSGNSKPLPFIIPSLYQFAFSSFRLFNDYSPGGGVSRTSVGLTLDPCGSGAGLPGVKNPNDNKTGPSIFGDQYHISEVRVDGAGQKGWKALNNGREIPWVWSVIEFDPNGYPDYGRIRNSDPTATTPTTNYQIFPTYYIYVNGFLTYTTKQGTPGAFARVPPGGQLDPSLIQ